VREFRTSGLGEFENPDMAARAAAELFVRLADEAIRQRGGFFVALAGGTSFQKCLRLLAEPQVSSKVDWTKVVVFFGDERCVAEGHPDRNDAAADATLLRHVSIPPGNVRRVDAMAADAAERYEAEIRRVVSARREGAPPERVPSFDLIFLGLGPDGHTASLFPGHPSLDEEERLVLKITGSPKPPPSRITFTFPLLNAARCVAFLVTGADRAEAFFAAMLGQRNVPAGLVNPLFGKLVFLADREAATVWRAA
jgi:6-phosphogluconolactonase